MWKKIILGVVIVILIAGGTYWFIYTKELHVPVNEAINAIPGNAAIIIESKQSKNSWKKLSINNSMWEELLSAEIFEKLNHQILYIDSLLELNPHVSQLLNNRSLFVSAHISGASTFDFLYVYSLPTLKHQATFDEFIRSVNNNSEPFKRIYDGVDIATIHPRYKDSLSYAFLRGILMISSKQNLVEDAIRHLKSGISLALDKNFSKVINTAGKNVDANLYVNYKKFPGILNHFTCPLVKKDIASLADFADCSGWDASIKSNGLVLSGFTQANDSSTNFLNLFKQQNPHEIELTKIIPSKTALLLFFGISNIKTFHHDYKNYLRATLQGRTRNYNQFVESLKIKYSINIEHSMLEWIDNEIALVITEPNSSDFANNSYAVFHSNNIEDALLTLNSLADSINKKDKKKISQINYRNHVLKQLNIPKLLPQLLGWQFNKITNNCYTSIDDYIVFANNQEALQNFINDFENNKTLANDKNYKIFSENISAETNIYLYSSIARSTNIYSAFVNEELTKNIENKLDLFHKFEAVGIQFTSNKKLFYSNAYLKYNPKYKQESGTLWESKLDTTVSSKPYIVINHNTKVKEIVVQDDGNKIYLISNSGKIIWAKQLDEKIISDVVQVDVLFKNSKLQLIFNTHSAIYMFDRNGNNMKGFPVQLKSPATNGISVFDYEKNRNYRIFVACENKKIICFKQSGEIVKEFDFEKTNNTVYLPLQYFNINGKDHLFAVDVKGKIYILNRQGEVRIKIMEELPEGTCNFYIEPGKDNNNSFIIAADTLGNIKKVSLDGKQKNIKTEDFESVILFDYKDIDNDNIKEYIFLSGNELKVFSQKNLEEEESPSLLFKYEFQEKVSKATQFFNFLDETGKIGVVSETANKLYLFNSDGSLHKGFPLEGTTHFSISDINNEGIYNVITGSSNNSIYLYQLE